MLSYTVFINCNDFFLLFRTHHLWNSTTEMKLLYVYDLLRGIWILNRQAFSRRISCLHTARIHRLRTHLWRHQQSRHHLLRAYDLSSLANFLFEVNLKFKIKVSLLGVDSLLGVCTFIPGVIVVDLCYFALFEDFSL